MAATVSGSTVQAAGSDPGIFQRRVEVLLGLHADGQPGSGQVLGERPLVVVHVLAEVGSSRDHDRSATGGPNVHDAAGTTRDHDRVGLFDLGAHVLTPVQLGVVDTDRRPGRSVLDDDGVVGVRIGPALGPADEAIEGVVVGADAHEDAACQYTGPATVAPG